MSLRDDPRRAAARTFLNWPVVRQLSGADKLGRGAAVKSPASRRLQPRIAAADKVLKSVCPYCAVGCGQNVFVKDGKVVQIEGDADSPVSRGRLCPWVGSSRASRRTSAATTSAPGSTKAPRSSPRPASGTRSTRTATRATHPVIRGQEPATPGAVTGTRPGRPPRRAAARATAPAGPRLIPIRAATRPCRTPAASSRS